MELQKFYQINTGNNVVYVVTGTEKKSDALKFVSQYKKEKYASMILNYRVVNAKIVGNDLYVGSNDALSEINGVSCLAVMRKKMNL